MCDITHLWPYPSKGLYLIVYPQSNPNTDSLSISLIFRNYFFTVIQGREILEELIISI